MAGSSRADRDVRRRIEDSIKAGTVTPEQQIETQAETIKALWVKIARLKRRCEIQQWIIDKAEADQPPTWKERIMQEANEVFKDG